MMNVTRGLLALVLMVFFQTVQAQQVQGIRGKIVNENAAPVEGATIRILNSNSAAVANSAGEFLIEATAGRTYTFLVSAIGYTVVTKEATVTGSSELNFVLHSRAAQLEPVVVSAQKREEVLQNLPLSVTALSATQVQESRLWNTRELTGIVPGLYADDPGDKRTVVSIRGITTTSYDPAVAVYVDGVNQFNLDTYISPLFDVERIEVLRGPQGTLYGRNAMGGVINIITKQPTNKTTVSAEASVGNYNQQRYSIALKVPVVKGKLFAGVAGLYERSDGFYTNTFNNTKYDRQHTAGGNYSLHYLPGKNWNLALNLKHISNRNHGPFPLVFGAEQALKEPFQLSQNATTKMVDNILNTSFSLSHSGRAVNFSAQTAFQSNNRYYTTPIDADFSPIDGLTLINNFGKDWNRVKVLTQEFRFTNAAASTSPLQWTAGAYFFHQNSPVKQATHFGNDAAMMGSPDVNFSLINTTKATATGGALFAQGTYRLTKRLDLVAGLRYDRENREQTVLGEYQKDPNPEPLFAYRPDTSASARFDALSPKLGLTYRVSPNQILFSTYSRGFRTGGLTQLSSDPSQPALFPFKPEYSNNVELGSKLVLLNNRLLFNLSLFYAQVTDAQVPTLVLPDAVTLTRNTGKLTSKGFETEIQAKPWAAFTVTHSFGYTNARFGSLVLSQNGTAVNLKGNRQVFTPDMTSMLALQYSHHFNPQKDLALVVRGEWKYLGTQYFDLANSIRQAAYNLYNTRAGLAARNWSLFAWGRNLFNQRYIAYGYDFGAVNLGDPRTYGVTLNVNL